MLKPSLVHTHTKLYQIQINRLGFKNEILPLFGNINNVNQLPAVANNVVNIAVFGVIDVGAKLQDFVNWLKKDNKIKFVFHFIGNNGNQKSLWQQILNDSCIEFKQYGWLEANKVSVALANCQLGVTRMPYYLVQKSGSVAAMLDHGLNVLCIAREWIPLAVNTNDLVNDLVINWHDLLSLSQILNVKKAPQNILAIAAENFENQIKKIYL